ncbi:hypothetical protein L6452_44692 [Arctium lappa]|uniref:Uncharacterized protein n=1 Tax=Arctium lappa TaxID=4217 RepID=A0ACB8XI76_ARCLA|nr:hypothetical protein L6452_44692 [Arctium lappa]
MEADQDPSTPPNLHLHEDTLTQQIDRFISSSSSTPADPDHDPPDHQILESVQCFALLFDEEVVEYESGSKKWTQDETSSFIVSVERTAKLLDSLSRFQSQEDYAAAFNQISGIQQRALSFMEDEFKSILDDYQTSYDRDQKNIEEAASSMSPSDDQSQSDDQPVVVDDNKDNFLGYSDEMISNLKQLAKGLIGGGHQTECSELYFFVRRNAIEQNLKLLPFEKFSIDEMQKMQWEPIEKEVSAWTKMFKDFTTSLLPSERRLVDAVFSSSDGHTAISDSLFGNLARIVLFYFLTFAEAVMMTKRAAEKLFKFLDIYETLRDSIPEVEKYLSDDWLIQLRSAASLINNMLGDAIFTIFGELENSIKGDTSKTAVPGGAVHPLTRYTMNYLKLACEYRDTLQQVFREHKRIDRADSATGSDCDPSCQEVTQNLDDDHHRSSSFELQLGRVMDLLDANLEAKSKLYKDPSLSLIFLMNNGRYILQKTKGTGEMRSLMGDPWVRKRSSDLRSYHTNYKRETWTKLLQCLSHEGLSVNGKVMKPVLKERFKSFNAMFDEIHRTQSTWVVSDEQLQSELRVSISAIIIPAYRSFMGRFSQVFTPGRQTEKYIKYQPEDIETCIEELFDGNAAQQGKKR